MKHDDASDAPRTDAEQALEAGRTSRRTMLFLGLGLLAGCAESKLRTAMPGPAWPNNRVVLDTPPAPPTAPAPTTLMGGVIPRSAWAKGPIVPSLMNRMLPVRYITVHHTAMYFTDSSESGTAAMMERVRLGHRDRNFGDIGYHFAVDRAGRVWQGRELAWQGAHVAHKNEGNIGVVSLGNFDEQSPTGAQTESLRRFVVQLMHMYNVSLSSVKTHQEWAPTRCPGTNLQRYMVQIRSHGMLV